MLEVAAERVYFLFDEAAEILEKGAGGLLGLGLGPVGMIVSIGLGGDGSDLGGDDAFEDDLRRGAS